MNFNKILYFFLFFLSVKAFSQNKDLIVLPLSKYPPEKIQTDEYGNRFYYDERQKAKIYEINGETVVIMDELVLQKKPRFNNQLDRNFYYFINKKLYRVYPLFLVALEQYRDLQTHMQNMESHEKRKFVKARQQELATEYETKLRDLTTTEGQIFGKLMYRATGKTVYEIIKELRGGWSAFWWNIKGKAADIELKREYNPHKYREDEYLESLLQSNWNLGYLQPYIGHNDFKINQ
ncbi:MAG: DUF4294 domain-containing protein [Bergeyella zoohelcum]|nr:DUF4294 domain-containing protein [Bergeyella zoohelcum]